MREILFRGKRKDNGEWAFGYFVYAKSDFDDENLREADIVPHDTDRVYKGEYNVVYTCNPETVGQYTGLKDKNGTRIFEDDIVNDEQSGYNYFIKWFPEYACFALANKNGRMEFGCEELEIFLGDLIVIGNIYDNPEFLKGE